MGAKLAALTTPLSLRVTVMALRQFIGRLGAVASRGHRQ
jgi:hypothetical protein